MQSQVPLGLILMLWDKVSLFMPNSMQKKLIRIDFRAMIKLPSDELSRITKMNHNQMYRGFILEICF